MGFRGLFLATLAAISLFAVAKPAPAHAASAALSAIGGEATYRAGTGPLLEAAMHRHRAQSYYCYPRNYWWFYRPYTTAHDGHLRCMPYFHYLEPHGGRGAKSKRSVK